MTFIPAESVLKLRNEIHRTCHELRTERNWLDEHKFCVEAKVKQAIVDSLEKFQYRLEDILDKAAVKYHYDPARKVDPPPAAT
jgi:hypothetical protein